LTRATVAARNDVPLEVVRAADAANDRQKRVLGDKIEGHFRRGGGTVSGRTVAVWGLAFKPGTDDVRESASLKIVARLAQEGAAIVAHDPIATENFRKALGGAAPSAVYPARWQDEVADADILLVVTNWPEYQELRAFDLAGKTLFDARRAFAPTHFPGAKYLSIGRQIGS